MPTPIITRLRDIALGMMGLEDITHAPSDLTERILSDANRAIQFIGTFADDTFHYEEFRGVYVREKTVTTVDVTNGSNTISNLSGSASWMLRCTCQIEGSDVFNRLRKTSAGTFELSRPYLGVTGTGKSITIWHDAIQLPTDVLRIKPPFTFGGDPIAIMLDRDLETVFSFSRTLGVPSAFAEISIHGGDEAPFKALMLNALPAGNTDLTYTAVGTIPNFADFNDTRVHVIPFDLEDSVLIPMFRYYLTGYNLFEGSKEEYGTDAKQAMLLLERLPRRSAPPSTLRRPKQ